jgi:tetratricopeptide (TPR) repeat protein
MRTPSSAAMPLMALRRTSVLAAACLCACTTFGAAHPAPIEVREGGGFTITERVRVGSAARSDFEQALRLLEQEQYGDAITLLVKVTEAAPRATAAHIDLGMAYARAGQLEQAEASLQKALALNPRHPVAHNELGMLYRKMGRFQEARQSYERALALYPDFHFARRNLAILCDLYLADPECALSNYELYTKAAPDDETAAMWVADLRSRAGR